MKVLEFVNIHQGNMSVKHYALNFIQLVKYAPTMVVGSRAFVSAVSEMVVKECHIVMLIKEMDISDLMIDAYKLKWKN